MAIVQRGVVKSAHAARGIEILDGGDQRGRVDADRHSQFVHTLSFHARKHRRHEAPHGLGIDDGVAGLSGLHGHQPTPDGIAFGPEVLAFVVEALALLVHDHAQGHTINAGANTPVIQGRSCINGHHVGLRGVTDAIGSMVIQHMTQQGALVVPCTANQKIVRRPFAALILSPGFTHPGQVGLKASGRQHAGAGFDALALGPGCHKPPLVDLQSIDRRLIADLHPQAFGTAVIRIHQRLAPAHEKGIGAGHMQGPGQRRLKMHTMATHPVAAV